MEKLKEFWNNYKGAIIGVIVAILILATKIYNLIVATFYFVIMLYRQPHGKMRFLLLNLIWV